MKLLVYVAGPYTAPDPVENTHRALNTAGRILDTGLMVPLVPHLSLFWHFLDPRPYIDWLSYDLELMARCDAVYRIEGESPGADGEVKEAQRRGIPVFTEWDELAHWADLRSEPF